MKTNYGYTKATVIVCLVTVLFAEGCSTVPPSVLQPSYSKPEGVIRSTYGIVQSSTGAVGIKSVEVVTSNHSEKNSVACASAPAPPYAPSRESAGAMTAKAAVELPMMVLQPQYLAAAVLALVVAVPVLGVAAIVKRVACSTGKMPNPEDKTPPNYYNNGDGSPLRSAALAT